MSERLLQLEQRFSDLATRLDRLANLGAGQAYQMRLGRTVAGAEPYPAKPADTFHVQFLDGAYPRTPGDQSPVYATRGGQTAVAHEVNGMYIPEGTLVRCWNWGSYWWTQQVAPTEIIPPVLGLPLSYAEINRNSILNGDTNYFLSQPGTTQATWQWLSDASSYPPPNNNPPNREKGVVLLALNVPATYTSATVTFDIGGGFYPETGQGGGGTESLQYYRFLGVPGFYTEFPPSINLGSTPSWQGSIDWDLSGISYGVFPTPPTSVTTPDLKPILDLLTAQPGYDPLTHWLAIYMSVVSPLGTYPGPVGTEATRSVIFTETEYQVVT